MKNIFICLLFLPLFLQAQDFDVKKLALIEELANYRASLITEDFEKMALFVQLIKKWNEQEISEETQGLILLRISFYINSYNASLGGVRQYLEKYFPDLKIAKEVTNEEIIVIAQNSHLIDLIYHGILKQDYPFILNKKSKIYEELEFYEIEGNEVIGEIGAGDGTFNLILALYDKNISLYVNEIDFNDIVHIEKKVNDYAEVLLVDRMKLVLGEDYRTNFKRKAMDKIIIRNTFHHFTRTKSMLKSIKKNLKKEGELYIYEYLPKLNIGRNLCKKLMTEEFIKTTLKESGFTLEKEIILGGVMIMKYKVTEKN